MMVFNGREALSLLFFVRWACACMCGWGAGLGWAFFPFWLVADLRFLFFLLLGCLYLGLAVSDILLAGMSSLAVCLEPCLCGPCGARGGAVRAPLGVFRRVAVLCAVCSARCSFFGGVFMCKCKCST